MSNLSRALLFTLRRCKTNTIPANSCCLSNHFAKRLFSDHAASAIQPPTLDGQPKEYDPKIVQLVEYISKLNLREVADLNALLKETLNISDAPVMAAVTQSSAPGTESKQGAEVETVQEQTEFTVKVTSFEANSKIKLIKAIKVIKPDLNLVQAKKMVESLPQIVGESISKEEAEALKKQLEEAGAKVEMR